MDCKAAIIKRYLDVKADNAPQNKETALHGNRGGRLFFRFLSFGRSKERKKAFDPFMP
jgi:hypothetical protein